MTDTTQAVVETPVPAQPGATVDNARAEGDDLSSLLAEFDNTTKAAPVEQPKPAPTPQAPDNSAVLRQLQTAMNARDISDTIKSVREGIDPSVSDRVVKGLLNAMADENPKLNEIFQNRYENPALFDRTLKSLNKELRKEVQKMTEKAPDKGATEDREAVAAAVRGSSNRLPEGKAPDFGNQSNAEFRKSVKEKYGYDPGV